MEIKPIKTDADYREALAEIDKLWGAKPRTSAADKLDVLATIIDAYERKNFLIEKPTPIEAIRFRMDQLGLRQTDLQPYLGSRGRVSEILNGKRPLTLRMIRKLHKDLGIPADVLIQ